MLGTSAIASFARLRLTRIPGITCMYKMPKAVGRCVATVGSCWQNPLQSTTTGLRLPNRLIWRRLDQEQRILEQEQQSTRTRRKRGHLLDSASGSSGVKTRGIAYIREDETSLEARDENEEQILSSGAWASITQEDRSITSLRNKPSRVLVNSIRQSLPRVIEGDGESVGDGQEGLGRPGKLRTSPKDFPEYLERFLE
ncbi:hypothetical protein BKA56DRAFT_314183 [Ilyonectria sp. MPI-CAGE-AT-0026]|nr:hypothetical protein BKA56DRAFT_314183 [Ilyonectria sp. MPI-CAGE-AT-0026]